MTKSKEHQLCIQTAFLSFQKDQETGKKLYNQKQIANLLDKSPTSIKRYLEMAEDLGFIKTEVKIPEEYKDLLPNRNFILENSLFELFKSRCIVFKDACDPYSEIASYLTTNLRKQSNQTIITSWGYTLRKVANSMGSIGNNKKNTVYPLSGDYPLNYLKQVFGKNKSHLPYSKIIENSANRNAFAFAQNSGAKPAPSIISPAMIVDLNNKLSSKDILMSCKPLLRMDNTLRFLYGNIYDHSFKKNNKPIFINNVTLITSIGSTLPEFSEIDTNEEKIKVYHQKIDAIVGNLGGVIFNHDFQETEINYRIPIGVNLNFFKSIAANQDNVGLGIVIIGIGEHKIAPLKTIMKHKAANLVLTNEATATALLNKG
ncbi:sugar-binding transcriptional regulator [Desulfobacula toluolica]|uniref:Transcriptional regulator n=1 Tax=Desulfobacula toluolica (strain DSM 7467 / Tol2) TaxID=651182 RepID=K0NIH7_DESTT|nr:hypothetical protein [Desulfobacula toluolica]CCK78792.1 uncharacterized protein TOL2_C06230 [Desulfobacula toluolica Tol2]